MFFKQACKNLKFLLVSYSSYEMKQFKLLHRDYVLKKYKFFEANY